jgi:hypothetical protein
LGDPLAVLHVGLAPRDLLDVLGVDQQHLDGAFQQVEHRLAVHPGRCHGHDRDLLGPEPVEPVQQVGGRGPERLDFLAGAAVQPADTGDDGVLVDIQTGTDGRERIHEKPPRNARIGRQHKEK